MSTSRGGKTAYYCILLLISTRFESPMLFRQTVARLPLRFSGKQGGSVTVRFLSNNAVEKEAVGGNEIKEYKFYDGYYTAKIKMLRRISITSSFCSVFGLPLVISMSTGDMSLAAKISIASTAVVASIGSTAILHAITHPYVTQFSYVTGGDNAEEDAAGNYKFKAIRYNLFGNPRPSEFSLAQMEPVKVMNHPYANFQVDGNYYYVRTDSIENEELRNKISERSTKK